MSNTYRQLAMLIPAENRKEILDLNLIDEAVANVGSLPMLYLAKVWKEYIEPGFSADCNLCFSRCLNGFKELKPNLLELQKESELINLQ